MPARVLCGRERVGDQQPLLQRGPLRLLPDSSHRQRRRRKRHRNSQGSLKSMLLF